MKLSLSQMIHVRILYLHEPVPAWMWVNIYIYTIHRFFGIYNWIVFNIIPFILVSTQISTVTTGHFKGLATCRSSPPARKSVKWPTSQLKSCVFVEIHRAYHVLQLRLSYYPPVNKHSNGKSPFLIGNTSSNGGFSIAMLDYWSVIEKKKKP